MRVKKAGFTLVELMIAVSILTIGVVMVLRSFLNSAGVLDSLSNRLDAIAIIEDKIDELQEKVLEESGLEASSATEDLTVGNRNAILHSDVGTSSVEGINEVRLSLSWQEGNKSKDETLVVYLPSKK
jgi:prepilin-type N-terminal cleavage/methylation domain-containing protein